MNNQQLLDAMGDNIRAASALQLVHAASGKLLEEMAVATLIADGDVDGEQKAADESIARWTHQLMTAINLYKALMVDFMPSGKHAVAYKQDGGENV